MIYKRYLSKEILKTFSLVLISFYFIYVMIDCSTHVRDFLSDKKLDLAHFAAYYGFHFIKRSDLLIPLALMIASIRVLLSLNSQGELTALQASGLALSKIIRPFLTIAIVFTCTSYIKGEYLLPHSITYLDSFREKHFKKSAKKDVPFHLLYLTDGSKVFYQKEDLVKNVYFDVLWVRSVDEIWRIKYLSKEQKNPTGDFVDHLARNKQGNFEKIESFEKCRFSHFEFKKNPTSSGILPAENHKITTLLTLLKNPGTHYSSSEILTHLLLKLAMPLLCLLAALAPIPFCIQHSRMIPSFLIYTLSLFGFIVFFTLLGSSVILGEHHTLSPYLAILGPFIGVAAFIGWKFKQKVFA